MRKFILLAVTVIVLCLVVSVGYGFYWWNESSRGDTNIMKPTDTVTQASIFSVVFNIKNTKSVTLSETPSDQKIIFNPGPFIEAYPLTETNKTKLKEILEEMYNCPVEVLNISDKRFYCINLSSQEQKRTYLRFNFREIYDKCSSCINCSQKWISLKDLLETCDDECWMQLYNCKKISLRVDNQDVEVIVRIMP